MKKNAANLAIAQHPTVFADARNGGPPGALKPRVLIVDDERSVLDGLMLHLRRNYDVVARTSGAEALEALSQGSFHVVISDLRMPVMDGIQFLTEVRNRAPDTTRVLLTGFADVTSAIAAVNEAAVHRFLTKPCPPAVLAAALEEALAVANAAQSEKVGEHMTRTGRQATLGTMAGSIGHEIGTLVTALADSLQQVQYQVDRGEVPASEDIGVLGMVKNRMQDHTRALMDLARPRRVRIEHVDMGMLVCSAVELLKKAGVLRGVVVELKLPSSPLHVEADRVLLEGVLINLLKNSSDALGERALEAARRGADDDEFGESTVTVRVAARGEGAVALSVEDNGPGISAAHIGRIFKPYFTTKLAAGASGLGLAVVRETVEQCGGRVDVVSTEGKGAQFTVLLPLAGSASVDDTQETELQGGSIVRLMPRRA